MIASFLRDVRLGFRSLWKDRAFALTALLSIGLGVGANAAIFSLVDQALFRMLPVRDPGQLVLLNWQGSFVGHGWGSSNLMSYPFFKDLHDQTDVFDGVFGRAPTTANVLFERSTESVGAEIVTGTYFPVLGVRPRLGRLLNESDDRQPNAHAVVVLSYDYWQKHLGGREDIVGRTVLVNTHPMTVVGVAAEGFHGIDWGEVPSIWIPTMMKKQATPDFDWLLDRRGIWLHVFGRLKPGMTMDQAQARLQPWFKAMLQEDTRREDWPHVTASQQSAYLASSLELLPAAGGRSDLRGRLERPLLVLLAATALVLLLACLNVANLFLARGFARRRETALCLALGAPRRRIVQDLLIQCAMVAVAGGVLGVAIAPAVTRGLISFLPTNVAEVDLSPGINAQVFVFALVAAVATALLFGLAPAFRAARAKPGLVLKEESHSIGAGLGFRKVLVTAQIALALVLLIGAGLFVRTLASLRAKGPGFSTSNQMFVQVDAGKSGYARERTAQLLRTLLTKLRDLPEVEAGGVSVHELLDGGSWNQNLTIDNGRRFITDGLVHCNAITSGFFATLGVPIVAGRDFDSREDNQLAPVNRGDPTGGAFTFNVAIINESLARRYFGDRDPIGARIGLGDGPDVKTTVEIIGVVRTFSYRGVRETDDQAFFPFFQLPAAGGTFWLRTRASSATAFPSIRDTVRGLDSGLSIAAMRTVDEALDRSLSNERLLAMLASAFAGLAMLLAVVGVYGTISFVVSHRTREIGIRIALGASRANAMWLILRDASVMLGGGVAIAVPAVWLVGRLVESQLFGVRSMDWPTIGVAAILVTFATFAASALPVGRATAVSPMEALRCD